MFLFDVFDPRGGLPYKKGGDARRTFLGVNILGSGTA